MKQKVFLLIVLLAHFSLPQNANAYDYSVTAPSGQLLFYNIVNNEARVTYQNSGNNPGYTIYLSGNLVIPDSITINSTTYPVSSIGSYAFYYCSGITSITIPNTVTSVGEDAFIGCSGLTSTNYTGSITEWCNISFFNTTSNPIHRSRNLYINNVEVANLIIPNSVTEIKPCAFSYCNSLVSVTIPNTVNNIDDYAFYGCNNLTAITVPDIVNRIGNYAFMYCTNLLSITIGNSVSIIGESAFRFCSSIEEIYCTSSVPPTLGNNAFNGVSTTIPVYIPCDRTSSYQSLWSSFSNFIEPSFPSLILHNMDSTMGQVIIQEGPSCDSITVIEAIANYGYHFTQWEDGNNENPRTIRLSHDTSFLANFAKNQYTMNVSCNDYSCGTVNGSGTYDYLDTVTISANANEHYHFTKWNDGNRDNPRQIIVSCNYDYVAQFALDTHTVIVQADNIAHGSVQGGGEIAYGTATTVCASSYSGCKFSHWSDGATYNPYTFAVLEDKTLIAYFIADTIAVSVTTLENINALIYTSKGHIVVEGAEGNTVSLYDINGRLLATKNDNLPRIRFDVPTSGAYTIKIGNHTMRKVVVVR